MKTTINFCDSQKFIFCSQSLHVQRLDSALEMILYGSGRGRCLLTRDFARISMVQVRKLFSSGGSVAPL